MKMKSNLISLISAICILLVGMAMTGCAAPLIKAAEKGDIKEMERLIAAGADVNAQHHYGATSLGPPRGWTPLHFAAYNGKKEAAEFLISKGADVNAKAIDVYGEAPLHNAAENGNKEVVELLISKGADVHAKNSYGSAPLHIAAAYGKKEAAELLISKGADINARNNKNYSALALAALGGHTRIARFLLEKGADLNEAFFGLEKSGKDGKSGIALLESLAKERETTKQPVVARPGQVQQAEQAASIKSDVDELPAVKAKPNKSAYAIVIGIEQYRQKLPKADFSTNDAKTVTEYLTKAMGYPEENVVTLTNDRASLTDFIKYFEKWLPNNVEKDGSVFIYYSGHGAPNPKTGDAYLVPYDGDPSFIDQTGYSLKRLYENLGKLQTKEIVVALDSCFSGAGGRSVIAKGARPLVMTMEKTAVPSNIAVLSAASGDQISSTYEEKGHGLFTYFMLKGIKGEGDANGDGKIEIGELFEYIKPQVERTARKTYSNEQSPQMTAPSERHKMILIEGAK